MHVIKTLARPTLPGKKMVLAAMPIYAHKAKVSVAVEYRLALLHLTGEWGEVDERAAQMVTVDHLGDPTQDLLVEAGRSWGLGLLGRDLEVADLDEDEFALVQFSLENSYRREFDFLTAREGGASCAH